MLNRDAVFFLVGGLVWLCLDGLKESVGFSLVGVCWLLDWYLPVPGLAVWVWFQSVYPQYRKGESCG